MEDEKIFDPQVSVALSAPGPNDARACWPVRQCRRCRQECCTAPVAAPASATTGPTFIVPDLPDVPDDSGYGGTPPPLPKFATPFASNPLPPDIACR